MSTSYYIDYVSGVERIKVFDYDAATQVFTATADASGRATITVGASLITIAIEGVTAMTADNTGLMSVGSVTQFVAPSDAPRLEFMRQSTSVPARLAYLSKAKNLWAPDFAEAAVAATQDQFRFFTLAAIGLAGVTADSIQETL